MTTRVVVTGIGLITPVGNTTLQTWEALCKGTSGIVSIERFDTSDHIVKIAGEVRNLDASAFISAKEQRRNGRVVTYAVAATMEALQQSGLDVKANADDVGVIIGSGIGSLEAHYENHKALFEKGPDRVSPFYISQTIADASAGYVSIITGACGPNFAPVSACATSAHAIGESFETIRRGDAKAMITGGVEASITQIGIAAFTNMHALSRYNGDPAQASRPFDAERDGFVMGEGAGVLILEDLEFAQARGAAILGEIIGYGATADAYHITEPAPHGIGLQKAMRRALAKAGLQPSDIDYINAHGTSTPFNDRTETQGIKEFFGDHAYKLAISSTKSMIGHTLGAAGSIEAAATLLTLSNGIITPTINLEHPDPECDLDYVPNTARKAQVRYALSNSLGFGGHNAVLVMQRWDGK